MLRSIMIFVTLILMISINVSAQIVPIVDGFQMPFDGSYTQTCEFGVYGDCFHSDQYHLAEDYDMPVVGTPIYACADGIVKEARESDGYGGIVLIEHRLSSGEYVVSLCAHMNNSLRPVSVDQEVFRGVTIIGYIADTGNNGGPYDPHLHFGVHKGNYDSTPMYACNGGWRYQGYSYDDCVLSDWYDPSDFVASHPASSSIVGQFADGTISQEIVQKYNDMANVGNLLGDPWDNGGSVYVHPVSDFQVQQDFSDQDNGFTMPWTTITYFNDPWNSSRVGRLLKEGFWATYMNSSEEEGGYGWISLGVPVTNELPPDGYGKVKQRFWRLGDNYANDAGDWERRYLEWDPASSTITPLDADGNPMTWAECIASIGGQVASVASPDSRAFSANEMVSKSGQMHGGRAVSTSRSFFQSSLGDMPRSQSDGIYHSDIKVADFDQPFSLIDQQGYSGFYAMVGGAVIPIDPFTMNGDMTIYVGGPPPGADIQFSHWTIYPNPGTVGEEIHVEGEIWNEGGSSITVSELRLDFLDPNGSEVYGYSLYDTEFESGGGWYIWLNLYPYISGNHTARFRGLIDGQWQTYAIETVYVQSNPNQPVAAFFATPTSGTLPLDVQFTDESTNNPNDWFWNFGDGNTSTSQHPSHTYTVTGNYTVSLTAMNSSGNDLDIKMNYITVNLPTPVANFSATPMFGDAPLTVQFTNELEGGSFSSEWIFGDGSTSIEQNPDHIYITAGTYTVSLIIGDGAEADTLVRNDYIIVEDVFSGVEGDSLIVFGLDDNHPNPFNPQTVISYSLPSEQQVSLIIYDVRGRPVATLVDGVVSAGTHTTIWNGSDHTGHTVSSGVYFYRLTTNNNSSTRKMLLMK
jgi:PKD repeat protein/murein DD-endopeptidase MepM/ murein hydrolase activator NlpD